MYTSQEIRQKFLSYFKEHEHTIVASSALIPRNDPTLLFSNSGMVQFKQYFLGQEKPDFPRATTAQKCLRVSGKHNDLENVGRTARHHTFFEMLGNFSFGDYFKERAIELAWNFITKELELPQEKLYVTVYIDDDEAFDIWNKKVGLDESRIFRIAGSDNFWSMGDTGPCGPCSEIFVDQGEELGCGDGCGIGKCDCDRFLEIWNLVFMQYNQSADGSRETLPRPSIDTGMGLERITAVCQGKFSNFDGDLFQQIIQFTADNAGVKYSYSMPDTNDVDTALRVIADHSRSAAFLITDGVLPSNEGRGYVLRRLIRRALRFGTLIGLKDSFLYKTVECVIALMGDAYPELKAKGDFVSRVVFEEEARFRTTLEKGLLLLEEEIQKAQNEKSRTIAGDIAFKLYDTYGFPLDIVKDVAYKYDFIVDEEAYDAHMKMQKERARAAWKGSGDKDLAARFMSFVEEGVKTEFCGYSDTSCEATALKVLDAEAKQVNALEYGQLGYVLANKTPFYAASGGQVGDTGLILTDSAKVLVTDTIKVQDFIVHEVEVQEGSLSAQDVIRLEVTESIRMAAARNHTCTHILHSALREVLGDHVQQAGSLVGADRLRFDFSHFSALSAEEIEQVEQRVNAVIMAAYPVEANEMSQDSAKAMGAVALFGEKYGDTVRVVKIGTASETASIELCGGTHVQNSGQIGFFAIVSEAGVAAGTRRIEAVTGWNAIQIFNNLRKQSQQLCAELKAKPEEINAKVDALQKEVKQLRKSLDKASASGGADLMSQFEEINGVKVLAQKVPSMSVKAMRDLMDDIRSKVPSGVACIAADVDGKVQLLLFVSKDLHVKYTAPSLIKEIASHFGGSGGGRPDLAQAGGTNPQGLEDALKALKAII